MLGKLIKHEWNAVAKLLFPLYLALVVITCIGRVLLSTNIMDSLPNIIQAFSVMLYVLLIMIVFVGTALYLIIRFYKNYFTDEGYLMHTLPVTTNQKIISKTIVAFIFNIFSALICALSIFTIMQSQFTFQEIKEGLNTVTVGFQTQMNMSFTTFLLITLGLILIGTISQFLMCYASIGIGQLFRNHKIVGSIIAYVGLYVVSQTLSSISLLIIQFDHLTETVDVLPTSFIYKIYGISALSSVILCIIYYFITYFMMHKNLNLD